MNGKPNDPNDVHLIDTEFLDQPGSVAVYCIEDEKTTLIDAGSSETTGTVLDGLESLGVAPRAVDQVVVTHPHLDHAGGIHRLLEACPEARLYVHRDAVTFLTESKAAERLVQSAHDVLGPLGPAYGHLTPVDSSRVTSVASGDRLDLGDGRLDFFEASGHSPAQLCPYHPETGTLFVGDEVGVRMMGRAVPATPPPDFRYEESLRSLDAFRELNPERLAFPHFGWCGRPRDALEKYRHVLESWVTMVGRIGERHDTLQAVVDRLVEEDVPHCSVWPKSVARKLISVDAAGVLRGKH